MKPIAELLRYLAHPAITEIALTTGRSTMIKSLNGYEPVDSTVLTDEELTRALLTMVGPARVAAVSEKPMKWSVRAEGMATLAIIAVRRGEGLSLRIMRTGDSAGQKPSETTPSPGSGTAPPPPPSEELPEESASAAALAPVAPSIAPIRPSSVGLRVIKSPAAPAPAPAPTAKAPVPAPPAPAPAAKAPAPAAKEPLPPAPPAPAPARPPPPPAPERPAGWKDLPALLEESRRVGASDLHVVAGRPALFRVASELKPQGEVLSPEKVEQMLLPQVPARSRAVLERDGSCDFALEAPGHGRFRVHVSRQHTGLKGSFRVIAQQVPTLESLGLPAELAGAVRHTQGLILLTGPSGHGKTSTLAALVDFLNRETKRHVLTVEEPVEYVHPRRQALMSQREVGTHTRSFARALESALHEDPEVLVVGELRDEEAVRVALAASASGPLVLATMNAPSAAKALDRVLDAFPTAEQAQARRTLASQLRLVVSQRLVPRADGRGVVAAVEVVPGQRRDKGGVRLEDALAELVRAGKTTLELARGFAENPDELVAALTSTSKPPGRKSA